VYTTDRALNRVQHFEADGTFIEKWGRNGGDGSAGSGPGSFDDPRSVAVDNAGFVYVADAGNSRIQKFTSRGGFLSEFGNGRGGLPANIFFSMSAVAASQQVPPVIYVTDPIVGTGFPGAQPGPSAIQSFREFTPLPEPEKTAAGSLEKGTVTVREPGTNRFVELKADEAIPVGSTIDTREGTVQLLTANSRGQTQAARFHDGIFKFTQDRSGLVTLTLTEPLTGCAKPGKATAAARGPKVRQLWGSGRGRYRTEGRHSVGSVRGTVWLTRDTCDGTLTKVREGVVAVRDLAKKRTVLVKKGGRYFARAKKR
jgi:hypothetical protein